MSLLLLFHPRVASPTGDVAMTGAGAVAAEGGALAAGDVSYAGIGAFQATGATTTGADVSIAGVGDFQVTSASLAAGVVAFDGTGDLQAAGGFEAAIGGDVSMDGVSAVLVVGADASAPVANDIISLGASPWQDRKRRGQIELDEDLEDLTAFAVMAAQQLARDYVASVRR